MSHLAGLHQANISLALRLVAAVHESALEWPGHPVPTVVPLYHSHVYIARTTQPWQPQRTRNCLRQLEARQRRHELSFVVALSQDISWSHLGQPCDNFKDKFSVT